MVQGSGQMGELLGRRRLLPSLPSTCHKLALGRVLVVGPESVSYERFRREAARLFCKRYKHASYHDIGYISVFQQVSHISRIPGN